MKDGLISLQSVILESISNVTIQSSDYTVSTVDCGRNFSPEANTPSPIRAFDGVVKVVD